MHSGKRIIIYKSKSGLKDGLLTYFYAWQGEKPPENLDLMTPLVKDVQPWINYIWWSNPVPGVPSEFFAVKWSGFLYVPHTGTYRFYVTTDDGSRLWIDDILIIDAWRDQAPTTYISEPLNIDAGYHKLKYWFYNRYAFAEAVLGWIPPYGSVGVIPKEYFKHVDSNKVKFRGLTEDYLVKVLYRGGEKSCIPKARECEVEVGLEEAPIKAKISIIDRSSGSVVYEASDEVELWGGDELEVLVGIVKAS
ncbi:MAG: PA14 domain-containing protein [Desulfurococcaceae archaeon]